MDPNGSFYCCGYNVAGQLGNNTRTDSAEPVAVDAPAGVKLSGITAGLFVACAVAPDGVYCWGDNDYGQLGDGTWTDRSRPVLVAGTRGL